MTLTELTNSYLEFMIKTYSKTHDDVFSWETLKSYHKEQEDKFICSAIKLLGAQNLVTYKIYDCKTEIVTLNLLAVKQSEENTNLRKTYKILKELKSWI